MRKKFNRGQQNYPRESRHRGSALPNEYKILEQWKGISVMNQCTEREMHPLDRLQRGRSGRIQQITAEADMRRRLMDMGFVQGTEITNVYTAPSGEPAAYLVRGSVIALRRSDAACVVVYDDENISAAKPLRLCRHMAGE